MNTRIKPVDHAVARAIDAVSAACVTNRLVGDFIIGDEPRRWRVSNTPSADVTNWVATPGYHGSGHRPATYCQVVQMETNAAALQEQAERDWPDKVPAVAFAVGSAMLVADLSIKEIHEALEFAVAGTDDARPQNVAVTLGVGRGALQSTIGVRSLSANTFTQAEAPVTASDPVPLPYGQRRDVHIITANFPNAHTF